MKMKPSRKLTLLLLCAIVVFMIIYPVYNEKLFEDSTLQRNQLKLKPGLKYILRWKSQITFRPLGIGQQGFLDRNCSYSNCYITSDKNLLNDYTEFDVIAFDGPQVNTYRKYELPQKRSMHQKYVFSSLESSSNYPIYNNYYDNFFNWTWTYKLNSDLIWGYIAIKDMDGNTVGPKQTMHWMTQEEMSPISEDLRNVLMKKSKAAAWLVSNCKTKSKRELYAARLKDELKKYNLSLDIFGSCSKVMCENCEEMIRRDYFFYLAFENSFSEDYVTEKLSRALECNAVPIVYGGANYSRFLPNGSYLNARESDPVELAAKMNEVINDFEQYTNYFRWTNHYRYQRRVDSDYCDMCALLNNDIRVKNVTVYEDFREWWNGLNGASGNISFNVLYVFFLSILLIL